MNVLPAGAGARVLACVLPSTPVVQRLAMSLEDAGTLSVRAWLGGDDEGSQVEMLGVPRGTWDPWMVTLGGLDVRGCLAGSIAGRFEVPVADGKDMERLLMRSGAVASIAVEAGGVEGLHAFELQVQDRLRVVEGRAA
ncbi:hypothetical protein GCM10028787_31310 [Brachybacterium horti]